MSKPTVRLYLLSTLAGALEPCGCSKDQLGGLGHLAAFLASQADSAPNHLLLAAGPTLFIDEKLQRDLAEQDRLKASTIATALKQMGLGAWTPGFNDWAGGADLLARALTESGATPLAAGLDAHLPRLAASTILSVDGVKVGVIGLSDPARSAGQLPERRGPLRCDRGPRSGEA